jgi:hypothetical protein
MVHKLFRQGLKRVLRNSLGTTLATSLFTATLTTPANAQYCDAAVSFSNGRWAVAESPSAFATADLNNDGSPDLVAVGSDDVSVLLNKT